MTVLPENIPTSLYRYVRIQIPGLSELQHVRRILTERLIYFPRADQCDDPYDTYPAARPATEAEIIAYEASAAYRRMLARFTQAQHRTMKAIVRQRLRSIGYQDKTHRAYRTTVQLLSLTTKARDPRMWDEYASGGRGMCLEFSVNEMMRAGPNWLPQPVTYRDNRPFAHFLDADGADHVMRVFLSKTTRWSHQAEWRVILLRKDQRPVQEYLMPTTLLAAIHLGPSMAAEHRIAVVAWSSSRWPGVPILADA